jgi:hypothetical protein
MVYSDVPWKGRDERDLLVNITNQKLTLKPGKTISKFSEDFIKRTLVINEDQRINWD